MSMDSKKKFDSKSVPLHSQYLQMRSGIHSLHQCTPLSLLHRYQYCSPTNKTRAKQHCFASCSIDYLPSALCTYLLLPELLSNLHCPVAPFRFVSALRHGSANTSITVQSLRHLFFSLLLMMERCASVNLSVTQSRRRNFVMNFDYLFLEGFFVWGKSWLLMENSLESIFQESWFNLLRYLRRFNFF